MKITLSPFSIPWLQRLFVASKPAPELSPVSQEEEIPRYPPFMKGLPAAPVARILGTQTELIQAIEQALACPESLFQGIVLPVIARYAAFSHLLPASESHHHRGAGGLFRHGLEVAHWAALTSQDCLFATDATPKARKSLEPRWRLAVCFAGLLHDIGKPVSDIAVTDRLGEHTWNPCDENLTDWAALHHIDRYFLRWREHRHKRHEQFSALVIERVLTREARAYILAPGPDIMQAMLETIHGLDLGSKCYSLVMAADCLSVERDLKAHYHGMESAMGMPVERYLCDAMRRLVKSGHWLANEKGARIWRFQDGLYIVWRTAVKEILNLLDKDHIPGIPRDEDTLADILIERGLAIPKTLPNGGRFRYWHMQTETLNGSLFMLRLASIELVYSGEPPVAVDGMEVGDQPESAPANLASAHSQSVRKPAADAGGGKRRKAKESDSTVKTAIAEPTVAQVAEPFIPADLAAMLAMDSQIDSSLCDLSGHATEDVDNKGLEDKPPNSPISGLVSTIEAVTPSMARPQAEPAHTDLARQWLEAQGLAGQWLIQLAGIVLSEQWQWGTDLLDHKDQCLLGFPRTADALQLEANHFIKILDEKGWIVTDVLSPMRKVREIEKIRGLLLAGEPSAMFKRLLASTSEPIASLESKPAVPSVAVGRNSVPKAKRPPATTVKQTEQSSPPLSQALVENEPATKPSPIVVPAPDNTTPTPPFRPPASGKIFNPNHPRHDLNPARPKHKTSDKSSNTGWTSYCKPRRICHQTEPTRHGLMWRISRLRPCCETRPA
ncbi:MobH family relaxase [Methylomonas rosea]|uniref:TraI domain-containing protein n=1 Tax=Methylomonas rosea TaxID=2952227 RepID=A0ABT1TTB3_9GAMM|nr:MobH family relaxase [Methylomonas sp. WSC-7]MCQ8117750.1 TraI domain-containing protein [Methylomonas sp. WSC-7]